MSYLAQLKEKIGNTDRQTRTDKTDKSPSVSSVSALPALSVGNPEAVNPTLGSPRVELMGLIKAVGTLYAFTPEETAEATQIAFADPKAALACYRDVASRYALNIPADDRITCGECSRLVRGKCQAAKQGLMIDTQPDYSPTPDTPRRCEHFK